MPDTNDNNILDSLEEQLRGEEETETGTDDATVPPTDEQPDGVTTVSERDQTDESRTSTSGQSTGSNASSGRDTSAPPTEAEIEERVESTPEDPTYAADSDTGDSGGGSQSTGSTSTSTSTTSTTSTTTDRTDSTTSDGSATTETNDGRGGGTDSTEEFVQVESGEELPEGATREGRLDDPASQGIEVTARRAGVGSVAALDDPVARARARKALDLEQQLIEETPWLTSPEQIAVRDAPNSNQIYTELTTAGYRALEDARRDELAASREQVRESVASQSGMFEPEDVETTFEDGTLTGTVSDDAQQEAREQIASERMAVDQDVYQQLVEAGETEAALSLANREPTEPIGPSPEGLIDQRQQEIEDAREQFETLQAREVRADVAEQLLDEGNREGAISLLEGEPTDVMGPPPEGLIQQLQAERERARTVRERANRQRVNVETTRQLLEEGNTDAAAALSPRIDAAQEVSQATQLQQNLGTETVNSLPDSATPGDPAELDDRTFYRFDEDTPVVGGQRLEGVFEDFQRASGEFGAGAATPLAAAAGLGGRAIDTALPGEIEQYPLRVAELNQEGFEEFGRQAVTAGGRGVGQLIGGIPLTLKEATEFGLETTEEVAAGRGAEYGVRVGNRGLELIRDFGESAEQNPTEVGGALIGSSVASVGAIRGAQALGGPRSAKAVSTSIQPGEELIRSAASRGLVSSSKANVVPGVGESIFSRYIGGPEIDRYGLASETDIREAAPLPLTREAVDDAMGVSGPSLASRLRGRAQRSELATQIDEQIQGLRELAADDRAELFPPRERGDGDAGRLDDRTRELSEVQRAALEQREFTEFQALESRGGIYDYDTRVSGEQPGETINTFEEQTLEPEAVLREGEGEAEVETERVREVTEEVEGEQLPGWMTTEGGEAGVYSVIDAARVEAETAAEQPGEETVVVEETEVQAGSAGELDQDLQTESLADVASRPETVTDERAEMESAADLARELDLSSGLEGLADLSSEQRQELSEVLAEVDADSERAILEEVNAETFVDQVPEQDQRRDSDEPLVLDTEIDPEGEDPWDPSREFDEPEGSTPSEVRPEPTAEPSRRERDLDFRREEARGERRRLFDELVDLFSTGIPAAGELFSVGDGGVYGGDEGRLRGGSDDRRTGRSSRRTEEQQRRARRADGVFGGGDDGVYGGGGYEGVFVEEEQSRGRSQRGRSGSRTSEAGDDGVFGEDVFGEDDGGGVFGDDDGIF